MVPVFGASIRRTTENGGREHYLAWYGVWVSTCHYWHIIQKIVGPIQSSNSKWCLSTRTCVFGFLFGNLNQILLQRRLLYILLSCLRRSSSIVLNSFRGPCTLIVTALAYIDTLMKDWRKCWIVVVDCLRREHRYPCRRICTQVVSVRLQLVDTTEVSLTGERLRLKQLYISWSHYSQVWWNFEISKFFMRASNARLVLKNWICLSRVLLLTFASFSILLNMISGPIHHSLWLK